MANQVSAKAKASVVGVGLLVVLALVGGVLAYQQVPEGHEGVEKDWGAVNGNTLDSGANWIIPVMQSVQAVETRPRTYTMTNTAGEGARSDADAVTVKTINGSSVDVSITVRYTINNDEADQFVSDWNNEKQMEMRLIRPTVKNNLQDEGSSLTTTGEGAIYTNEGRERLRETTQNALEKEVAGEPITIERVQIRAIDLPDSIDQTLDEKEQAKQQVEVEREKVKQEEAKKEQQIVRAEADAQEKIIAAQANANATRIRGEALDEHPIVLQQQYIEALENGETVYVGETGIALTREVEQGSSTNSTDTGE